MQNKQKISVYTKKYGDIFFVPVFLLSLNFFLHVNKLAFLVIELILQESHLL